MEKQLEFLTELSTMPSQLNTLQEQELSEMEDQYKSKNIEPWMKDRLKSFWRMKYHAQLMTTEDQALFYLMKELESLGELQTEQVDMLFALQRFFNCLPYITLDQLCHMDKLERMINEGAPLDEDQQKDLARLKSLPN